MDRKVKQTSLLSYWTMQYFIILLVGLLLLATAAIWWTNRETLTSRLQTVELLAQEIADRLNGPEGTIKVPADLEEYIDKRSRFFKLGSDMCVIVTDMEGRLFYSNEPLTQEDLRSKLNDKLDKAKQPGMKAVTAQIEHDGIKFGQVTLLQRTQSLQHIRELKWAIVFMLVSLTALGWLTIYLLSRKLVRPIRNVALAAREISLGHYDVQLEANAKEQELNEMIISFKDMASRLKQLEHSRNFMLAGLTHELKTPVTSVKGLVHSVKEKVVQGEEADEFLAIALEETGRLERMVSDLLDYNALEAGLVRLNCEAFDAVVLVAEIIYQWTLHQDNTIGEPALSLLEQPVLIKGDPLRVQQIMVNLLNNIVQSQHTDRQLRIQVSLRERDAGFAEIVFADNGKGIPQQEQDLIFERFFRGENKKHAVRGLGLGLTFSRLLALAQGGELSLRESTLEGSVFVLTLPIAAKRESDQS